MPNPNLKAPGAPGLLTNTTEHTAHSSGKHLYHKTKPPVVPLNEGEEKRLKADGYQEEYIPQDFPKLLVLPNGLDDKGKPKFEHVTVKDEKEEAKVRARYAPKPEAEKVVA